MKPGVSTPSEKQLSDTQQIQCTTGLTQQEYEILYKNNKNLLQFYINIPDSIIRKHYFGESYAKQDNFNHDQSSTSTATNQDQNANDQLIQNISSSRNSDSPNQKYKEKEKININTNFYYFPNIKSIYQITIQQEEQISLFLNEIIYPEIQQQFEHAPSLPENMNQDSQDAISPGVSVIQTPVAIKFCLLKQQLHVFENMSVQESIKQIQESPYLINLPKLINGISSDKLYQSVVQRDTMSSKSIFNFQEIFFSECANHEVKCTKIQLNTLPETIMDIQDNFVNDDQSISTKQASEDEEVQHASTHISNNTDVKEKQESTQQNMSNNQKTLEQSFQNERSDHTQVDNQYVSQSYNISHSVYNNDANKEDSVKENVFASKSNDKSIPNSQEMSLSKSQNCNQSIVEKSQHSIHKKHNIILKPYRVQNIIILPNFQQECQQIIHISIQQHPSFDIVAQLAQLPNIPLQQDQVCLMQEQPQISFLEKVFESNKCSNAKISNMNISITSPINSIIENLQATNSQTNVAQSEEANLVSYIALQNNETKGSQNSILSDIKKQSENIFTSVKQNTQSNMNVSTNVYSFQESSKTQSQLSHSMQSELGSSFPFKNLKQQQIQQCSNLNISDQMSFGNNESISNFKSYDIQQQNVDESKVKEVSLYNDRELSQTNEENNIQLNQEEKSIDMSLKKEIHIAFCSMNQQNDYSSKGNSNIYRSLQFKPKGNKLSKILNQQRNKQSVYEDMLNLYNIKDPQPGILQFLQQLQPYHTKQIQNINNKQYNDLLDQQPKEIRVQIQKHYI